MDYLKAFMKLMETQSEIALATSVNNKPNVRVLNFYHSNHNNNIVYFSSFKDNTKIKEFEMNNQVSFTTIPKEGNQHVRVKAGLVKKSDLTIYDLRSEFSSKIPDYETIIEQAGDQIVLFEISFKKALVTMDINATDTITF